MRVVPSFTVYVGQINWSPARCQIHKQGTRFIHSTDTITRPDIRMQPRRSRIVFPRAVEIDTAPPKEASPTAEEVPDEEGDMRFESFDCVLVTGATGGVGREVVKKLCEKGVRVRAMVKDTDKAEKLLPNEAEVMKGDVYQIVDVRRAFAGTAAVICASAASNPSDPLGPFSVDYTGTVNLVDAAMSQNVSKFVLVSSIGTDGPLLNPLNLFWGILFWKKRAEEYLQRSTLASTIVRPGGLVSTDSKRQTKRGTGPVAMMPPGTYGFPPKESGSIKRDKVAECCIEALVQESAVDTVVEIISKEGSPDLSWGELFESLQK